MQLYKYNNFNSNIDLGTILVPPDAIVPFTYTPIENSTSNPILFSKLSFDHISNEQFYNIVYSYYFTKILEHMLITLKLPYQWNCINDKFTIIDNSPEEDLKQKNLNPFLKESNGIGNTLANDVIKNGMYFPFFTINNLNQQPQIRMGKHRYKSLLLAGYFNKEFLFIDANDFFIEYHLYKQNININKPYISNKQLPILMFSKDAHKKIIYLTYTNNIYLFQAFFCNFVETLSSVIFPFRKIIQPLSFINNKQSFYKWLEHPIKNIPLLDNFS